MLLVKTVLGPSKIQGLGVFADEALSKGQKVWKFTKGFDFLIPEEEALKLPKAAQENLKRASTLWQGNYCVFGDYSRFINHSETPNLTDLLDIDETIAARDIQVGEELTEDYHGFLPTESEFKEYFPLGVK